MTDAERGDDGSDDPDPDPAAGSDGAADAVILDYLPHGRPDDDRPRYEKAPVAYGLGSRDFRLVRLELVDDADAGIGDRVRIEPVADRERVAAVERVDYEELTNAARSELEYVVTDLVETEERRFVDFFNEAQPITLRLHQLNLLPGIGKKLRNGVLDERKRGPFESFEDLSERVSGLHDPKGVLVDRIMEELREDDLKYRIFVREDDGGA
jgi:putative nucleotide binding protein